MILLSGRITASTSGSKVTTVSQRLLSTSPASFVRSATSTTAVRTAVRQQGRQSLLIQSASSRFFFQPNSRQQPKFSFFSHTRPLFMSTSASPSAASEDGGSASVISGQDMLAWFGASPQGTNVAQAMEALAMANCVCFDVDSTVVDEEGIDVLADHLGKGDEVAALTLAAMEGGMKFQDALQARLALLQPSRQSIEDCLQAHPLKLTTGVHKLIKTLHATGKDVWLVSGGFRIMIEPVAELLDIPKECIVANTILFNDDGTYRDFDANEPTSQDMGKPAALRQIQQEASSKGKNYKTMIMVGDGATDAQAKPPAAVFIGYGGIAVREKVQTVADWFVTDFDDMTRILDQYAAPAPTASTKK